jgi:N-acetylmuramic acid 6-phosphate etherase
VLDASECPPTFRTDPRQVQGAIAGGFDALVRSAEGEEDRPEAGVAAVTELSIGSDDVVVGIAAGGTTPFVHAALAEARRRGAATGFIACVPAGQAPAAADVQIRPITGPEVITGSTRMKAGTATKLILNMITTAAFVRLGKTYGPSMVDLKATNAKLWDRGTRLVMDLCALSRDDALALLQRADGRVKVAVIMHRKNCAPNEAERLLDEADGRLREAVD